MGAFYAKELYDKFFPAGPPDESGSLFRLGFNSALENRGGLRFNYPFHIFGDRETKSVAWLPFFENPSISESRKARYASQPIFGRNEPVRLFTGSEAREFKVEFYYTPVHMMYLLPTATIIDLITKGTVVGGWNVGPTLKEINSIKEYVFDVVARDVRAYPEQPLTGDTESNPQSRDFVEMSKRSSVFDGPGAYGNYQMASQEDSTFNYLLSYVMHAQQRWVDIQAVVLYFINHIRSSVIGSKRFSKGPPIVELKFGALYDFSPSVVLDYKIEPMEDAGYDLKSLIPNRVKVMMTLQEIRNVHGNQFGDPSVTGDLPGWDSIMELGRIDPLPGDRASDTRNPGFWTS